MWVPHVEGKKGPTTTFLLPAAVYVQMHFSSSCYPMRVIKGEEKRTTSQSQSNPPSVGMPQPAVSDMLDMSPLL